MLNLTSCGHREGYGFLAGQTWKIHDLRVAAALLVPADVRAAVLHAVVSVSRRAGCGRGSREWKELSSVCPVKLEVEG